MCTVARNRYYRPQAAVGGLFWRYPSVASADAQEGRVCSQPTANTEVVLEFIRSHPEMSLRELGAGLKELGIGRGKTWISEQRMAFRGTGTERTEAPE